MCILLIEIFMEQDEGDNDDQDDAEVNDGGIDFIADPIDPNLDADVPVDDDEDDILPRKQKFRHQSDLCDENNFEKLPDQQPPTYVWSNTNND